MGVRTDMTYEIDGVRVSRQEYYARTPAAPNSRPKIDVNGEDQLTHNGTKCRVVLQRDLIRIGCSDVTPRALRHLLTRYEDHFGHAGEIVLQAGNE